MARDTVYQMVTDQILKQLDQGTVPWRVPWDARDDHPRNINGWRYRGINVFLLAMQRQAAGYSEPYWMTYKQATERGGHVRKGGAPEHECKGKRCERQHASLIYLWRPYERTEVDETTGQKVKRRAFVLRFFRVFNLDQTEGVKLPRRVLEEQLARESSGHDHDPIAEAEAIAAGYVDGPEVREVDDARAFYVPATDVVTVPPMTAYSDRAEYYSTLFHELGHSTGHKSRLARKVENPFGSHDYGREELTAEMTAAYLCAESGIESTVENSAAYLNGWRKKIREDIRCVVVAAGAASRAADHILGRVDERYDSESEAA